MITQNDTVSSFDTIYGNLSSSSSSISFTTFSGSCTPFTNSYNILFNEIIFNQADPFGDVGNDAYCESDTGLYVIDPDVFEMNQNGLLWFLFKCNEQFDSISWDYNEYMNNFQWIDTDNDPLTPDEWNSVLEYSL